VIDGTGKAAIDDATVIIVDERIDNVCRGSDLLLPDDATVIDAHGKTVIPGLFDGHTHVAGLADDSFVVSEDPAHVVDLFMREYLRHGVTTVRDTGNFDPDDALAHMRAHDGPGWPRFYGAGPVLDGPADPPAPWRWLRVIDEESQARAQVHELQERGVDFLKVYMWMRPPVLRALIEEAHSVGLRVTGHLGHRVSVTQAAKLGIDCIEHVRMGPDLLTNEAREELLKLPTRALDAIASWAPWRFVDPNGPEADRLIELLVERGVFFVPTLTWSRSILESDRAEVTSPPGIDRMPESVRTTWNEFSYTFDYTSDDFVQAKVELQRQMEFVARAAASGVRVVAGTDTTNPYVIPGSALHDELALLVRAGLTSEAAIHAGTLQAARALGISAELGSLEKRKVADIVVVDGDLRRDITASRRIELVLKNGQRVPSNATEKPETAR
jgi:imidazolonepropionase-like amidohydrolase